MTCVVAYAYWDTGLRPFTASSYVAIGIPVAVVSSVVAMGARRLTSDRPAARVLGVRAAMPWLLGMVLAAALEGIALALGGRSTAVPTLSTVIDHALAWHALRLVLFCAWLLIGSAALIGTVRGRRGVR